MEKSCHAKSDPLYKRYVEQLHLALANMEVTDDNGFPIDHERVFTDLYGLCSNVKGAGKHIYFIGNGASATMASHMAADFSKNYGCRSLAFNDIAMMTAVSNDLAYEECFVLPLTRFAVRGDILVTISSSGNSVNVLKAIEYGRKIGLFIITLSGMASDNSSRKLGNMNFWIPAESYGLVETGHQMILHCWLDTIMDFSKKEKVVKQNDAR